MKAQFKNPIKNFAPVFLMLAAMFIFGFGCNMFKPTPDPLTGWKLIGFEPPNKSIENDYKDYIQKLSTGGKNGLGSIQFFEDETGQHAVRIEIAINDADRAYILIYDKESKRIRVIKYTTGRYMS